MKTICYIIPYFGKLPKNFALYLLGCAQNPTIDWKILTDDRTPYEFPTNVHVKYCNYEEVKQRIKAWFDFETVIDRPWRLSLFKPAYGEIFAEELSGYDFWGHCDIDLMWGNIRTFYSENNLNKYERLGFLGHSTLYKNTPEVNARYKRIVPGEINYKDVFSGRSSYSFDENGMDAIYRYLNIPYFDEVVFADLEKYEPGFVLGHFPASEKDKNKYQIFTWENGRLYRNYLQKDGIHRDEFLYIHFFCRPMKYSADRLSPDTTYYMYPDVMTDKQIGVSVKSLKKYGCRNNIAFLAESLWTNRHKITWQRIRSNFRTFLNYKRHSNE